MTAPLDPEEILRRRAAVLVELRAGDPMKEVMKRAGGATRMQGWRRVDRVFDAEIRAILEARPKHYGGGRSPVEGEGDFGFLPGAKMPKRVRFDNVDIPRGRAVWVPRHAVGVVFTGTSADTAAQEG